MALSTYCPICTHSQAVVIDEPLLADERPAVLADASGVSTRTLSQHKRQHLSRAGGHSPRPLVDQPRPAEGRR